MPKRLTSKTVTPPSRGRGARVGRVLNAPKSNGRPRRPPSPVLISLPPLHGVIHIELHGVRRHLEALHLGHLQLQVGVDHVVGEHAALLQEVRSEERRVGKECRSWVSAYLYTADQG